MSASNNNDFVTVDMPSENDVGPYAVAGSSINNDKNDADVADRQRTLLKSLWSEATSTTDLPSPNNHNQLLHHRRTATNNSPQYSRKLSKGAQQENSPSKRRSGRHTASSSNARYIRRHAKIAKRVWLAAFAAFAASFLIVIHLFLYRVFTGSSGSSRSSNNGGASSHDHDVSNTLNTVKHGMPILGTEDAQSKMTLAEAHSHTIASIHDHSIDTTQYTIRINTWERNEQLLLSINHHAKCEGVKEIQVIWCDSNNEPPDEVVRHSSGKVKVEKHTINSLNERFKVILDPPTLGILSLDDDVLRPCIALDAAFIRWTRHPERMVGFDVRTHVVPGKEEERNTNEEESEDKSKNASEDGDDDETSKEEGSKDGTDETKTGKNGESNNRRNAADSNISNDWKYGYMSTTETSNRYSMTLPRASFIHRDYLDLYTMALPRPIYMYVAQNLECEDIAMSFLVSSLTNGRPPLVADLWAVKSMVKLYSTKKISGGKDHKSRRDSCVNDFAALLGLKDEYPLRTEKLLHKDTFFGYGADIDAWADIDPTSIQSTHLQTVVKELQQTQSLDGDERMRWLVRHKVEAFIEPNKAGMIEGTEEWKKRWETGER